MGGLGSDNPFNNGDRPKLHDMWILIDSPGSNSYPPPSRNNKKHYADYQINNARKKGKTSPSAQKPLKMRRLHERPYLRRLRERPFQSRLRERLLQQALQPFSEDTGPFYPCSQNEIDFHQKNVFPTRNKGPFVTCREATRELTWHNDPRRPISTAEQTAITNIFTLFSTTDSDFLPSPDLAIKLFSDLDVIFFAGKLSHNVTVQWKPEYPYPHDETDFRWGVCWNEPGQSRIHLYANELFAPGWTEQPLDPFRNMICTLLHEMCHAYANVRCNSDPECREESEGHGIFFQTRIAVVHKRAMSLFGLPAIDEEVETYKQHHFFEEDLWMRWRAGIYGSLWNVHPAACDFWNVGTLPPNTFNLDQHNGPHLDHYITLHEAARMLNGTVQDS